MEPVGQSVSLYLLSRPAGQKCRLDTPALHTSIRQITTDPRVLESVILGWGPGISSRAIQRISHPAGKQSFPGQHDILQNKERRSMDTGVKANSQVNAELPSKDSACCAETGWSEQKGLEQPKPANSEQ